jgi:hypothetical protein
MRRHRDFALAPGAISAMPLAPGAISAMLIACHAINTHFEPSLLEFDGVI